MSLVASERGSSASQLSTRASARYASRTATASDRRVLLTAAGNQRGVPGVLRGVMRSVLLMVSICVAMIAVLAAIFIVPGADPVHQIAERTAKTAGIPEGVATGPPQ
jgi:hypothetical protein